MNYSTPFANMASESSMSSKKECPGAPAKSSLHRTYAVDLDASKKRRLAFDEESTAPGDLRTLKTLKTLKSLKTPKPSD